MMRLDAVPGRNVGRSVGAGALSLALTLSLASGSTTRGLRAQSPADLDVRDKTDLFVQHIVKVADLDPGKYEALVLEYEIGVAIAELLHAHEEEGAEGEEATEPHDDPASIVVDGFVERALGEIFPAYARLAKLVEEDDRDGAREAARELAGSADPYVAAHAALALAEVEYRALRDRASKDGAAEAAEEAHEELIRACERISATSRLYLIRDHRACEIIALAFQGLKKPLLEFVQYAILLTDYYDLPKDVEARAKERLQALSAEVGFPLGTVAGWMNEVEKLLAKEVTRADPTQRQETEIVYALDKLIELQEARERKTCSSCGSGTCRGGCQSGRPSGNRSNSPARVSALAQAKGEFFLRGVSSANASTIWGQLKAKDAARTLQGFKGKLPARYERLLEQYYKSLSKLEE